MTISQVGTSMYGVQANATSVTANKPTGVKNGTVLVAALVSNNQAATTPSGWTKFEDDGINTFRSQLYYKVATAFEPSSYSFGGFASACPLVLAISAWSGVDNGTPIGSDAHVQTAYGSNLTEPATTPSVASACTDGRTVYVRAARRTDSSPGAPVSFTASSTELVDVGVYSGGTVSYSVGVYADSADFSSASTKAGLAVTANAAETDNVLGTFILTQAPTATFSPTPRAIQTLATGTYVASHTFTANTFEELNGQTSWVALPVGKRLLQAKAPVPLTADSPFLPFQVADQSLSTVQGVVDYTNAHSYASTDYHYDENGYADQILMHGYLPGGTSVSQSDLPFSWTVTNTYVTFDV